ncbi:MAG: hypothetical protein MUE94_05340 [Verrucomicrobia bacterium]|jgi:hypothetical protein|nr:hypothetical protein [Verrucomicrobiota bacterium]
MALFKHKPDPISDRARALNSQIAALEAQIRKYETRLGRAPAPSSPPALPASRVHPPMGASARPAVPARRELDLEEVGQRQLTSEAELANDVVHVNELGLRKFDVPRLISDVSGFFRAPTTSNPRLVSYLAAGGIQGLRPLRYEKRVARNRFIVFALILLGLLIGLLTVFVPR